MWVLVSLLLLGKAPAPQHKASEVTEDAVMHLVREHFERTGRGTPTDDPSLNRAATALANKALRTSADEAAGLLSVTEAVSQQAGFDPSPLALFIKAPTEQLLKAIEGQQWADEPADFMGVGLVLEGRQASLCLLLAHRRLEMRPFARSYKKPQEKPQRLCAALLQPLTSAVLYVTRPKGDVDEIPMKLEHSGDWCGFVPFAQIGRSAVEVLARGPAGPEVAALFFVEVGVAADEGDRVFVEPSTTAKARSEILARINSLRLSQKVGGLTPDPALDEVAQRYAERMAGEHFFAHVAPDGADLRSRLTKGNYLFTAAGENLGSSSGPLAAHFGIEHSPGHRKNLLEPGFLSLGVGIAKRDDKLTVVVEVLTTPLNDGGENPVEMTYQALNQSRSRPDRWDRAFGRRLDRVSRRKRRRCRRHKRSGGRFAKGNPWTTSGR